MMATKEVYPTAINGNSKERKHFILLINSRNEFVWFLLMTQLFDLFKEML